MALSNKELGDFLLKIRTKKDISTYKVHEMCGVSQSYLSLVENGKRRPSPIVLKKLSKVYGIDYLELYKLAGYIDNENTNTVEQNIFPLMDKPVAIPIVGKIAAGLPILAEENIIDYAFVPEREHNKRPNAFYLTVYGDSMNEKFKDGDLVLVDPDVEVENGDIAVVLVENEATVKEFHKEDNLIVLYPKSTNKEHQMQIYNPKKIKIKIIGKVVSFQGRV